MTVFHRDKMSITSDAFIKPIFESFIKWVTGILDVCCQEERLWNLVKLLESCLRSKLAVWDL